MTTYSKYNTVYRLQKWMDSVPGQTFLNYAYSWGASIVILGTLFKLTHIPGANLMLFIGMGTEVVVFFLSAFDRPFDKTAIGMELPTHVTDEHLQRDEETGEDTGEETVDTGEAVETTVEDEPATPAVAAAAGTIIIGGGVAGGVPTGEGSVPTGESVAGGVAAVEGGQPGGVVVGGVIGQPAVTPDVAEATATYVEELTKLTEILQQVAEQSRRIASDSEEMENLNRTLTGISRIYEMQLKSASTQIGTIEEINTQTRLMAQQIEQLNKIYARMIEAMTTNMGLKVKGVE